MGGASSRSKGQRGEREVIKLLQPIIDKAYSECGFEPVVLERNLMQSNKGGFDIVGLDWLALEVKFQETEHLEQWWNQTVRQASTPVDKVTDCGEKVREWKRVKEPILFFRKSRMVWNVRMLGFVEVREGVRIRCPIIISLDTFKVWFYHKLVNTLKR